MASASAPASSGNLGPGFDTLGLAFELRCRVSAEIADEWSSDHIGKHQLPAGAQDGVLLAAQAAVQQPLALTVDNDVPLSRGLGSSSAATAAAAACALATVEGSVDPQQVYELVAEFEDHGDNAAAAVFGGLQAVDGDRQPFSLELHPDWVFLVAVPDYCLSTSDARAVLTQNVDRAVIVRNLGRLMSLIEGLRTGDASLLCRAGGDELHELPRAGLHQRATTLMTGAREAGAAHASWSGAGPSVLAVCREDAVHPVSTAMTNILGGQGHVVRLVVATQGLIVG